MLNKELMLASNRQDAKDYTTYIVTVGQYDDHMIYGYSRNMYGNIDRDTVKFSDYQYHIDDIRQDNERGIGINLILDSFIDQTTATSIYLGRSDTKVNFGTPYMILESSGIVNWQGNLFTAKDVGKEIPIWLSTTPPPY
jgi:hypothetical protein|nr:MAG TPA: hypothetical protein [Caudoviricetes sp.]